MFIANFVCKVLTCSSPKGIILLFAIIHRFRYEQFDSFTFHVLNTEIECMNISQEHKILLPYHWLLVINETTGN